MYNFESVTEFVSYFQAVLENDSRLSNMSVTGEISGFKRYPSGHCYFSLKDADNTVSCVMFGFYAKSLDFNPEDGLRVHMVCNAGFYGQSGRFQLMVKHMTKLGKGDLREQYKQLFKKLSEEGLFAPDHKKTIPIMPRRIGVISSSQGAVIHDIIRTLRRRNPFFDLTLFPAAVQGEQAPIDICRGLDYFESENDKVDVIIIARGGGSYEDLFCFNDESLARRIYACNIPVISAVGHEVDYTICDYVSDLRVPTPTAAAEVVLPKYDDLIYRLMSLDNDLNNVMYGYIDAQRRRVDALRNHRALSGPEYRIRTEKEKLLGLTQRAELIVKSNCARERDRLLRIMDSIELTSPMSVLKRGYSIAFDKDGKPVSTGAGVKSGDSLMIKISDADIKATVESVDMRGES